MQEAISVNSTPTGTLTPTVFALTAGTKINSGSMRIIGATEFFQLLEINTAPSPPKSKGIICTKGGSQRRRIQTGVMDVLSEFSLFPSYYFPKVSASSV